MQIQIIQISPLPRTEGTNREGSVRCYLFFYVNEYVALWCTDYLCGLFSPGFPL